MTTFRLAVLAIASASALSSCATVYQSTAADSFRGKFGDASYCQLEAVRQHKASACGAACLESLLHYWKLEGTQEDLWRAHPPADPAGYRLKEIKAAAESNGLTAFAVSFETSPMPLLRSQIAKGRPVLLPIRCPLGRYFGDPIPIIERVDSTSIGAGVTEERYTGLPIATTRNRLKDHYVIAFGYDEKRGRVLLMDPAYGIVAIGQGRLLSFWRAQNYAALVCAAQGAHPNSGIRVPQMSVAQERADR